MSSGESPSQPGGCGMEEVFDFRSQPRGEDTGRDRLVSLAASTLADAQRELVSAASLEELALDYRLTGDSERLIAGAAGVVALVGLHHVATHDRAADELLDALPDIVTAAAADESEAGTTFSARLAEATERYCSHTVDHSANGASANGNSLPLSSLDRLVQRAQTGDARAMDAILATSQKIAYQLIRRNNYYLMGGEVTDLCQEGLIGALEVIESFNASRGSFDVLLPLAIKRRIVSAIVRANRNKHVPVNNALPLDSPPPWETESQHTLAETLPDSRPGPEAIVLGREELAGFRTAYLTELTDLERASLRLFANGHSMKEIVARLEVLPEANGRKAPTFKTVDNALQRARRKLAS